MGSTQSKKDSKSNIISLKENFDENIYNEIEQTNKENADTNFLQQINKKIGTITLKKILIIVVIVLAIYLLYLFILKIFKNSKLSMNNGYNDDYIIHDFISPLIATENMPVMPPVI